MSAEVSSVPVETLCLCVLLLDWPLPTVKFYTVLTEQLLTS